MATKTLQVICVTDEDCVRNAEFAELLAIAPNGRMIDFYTTSIEELSIIAKYRILPVPTIIVLSNSKVVMRMVNPPKAETLADIFQSLPSLFR
jgi:hypothetical protein